MVTAEGEVVVLAPVSQPSRFPTLRTSRTERAPRPKIDPIQRWRKDHSLRTYTPALVVLSLLAALIYSRRWLATRAHRVGS